MQGLHAVDMHVDVWDDLRFYWSLAVIELGVDLTREVVYDAEAREIGACGRVTNCGRVRGMDTAAILITLTAILCATGVITYAIASGNRRAELRNHREDYRDDTVENLVDEMSKMAKWQARNQRRVIYELLAALTEPITTPTPQLDVHETELAGQAADAIREFHDGFSGDPVDTPDWTDGFMPNERGDEPRIASARPGDSIVPGQGNWDAMMNEGRAVVGGEQVSGADQWEGERYDG